MTTFSKRFEFIVSGLNSDLFANVVIAVADLGHIVHVQFDDLSQSRDFRDVQKKFDPLSPVNILEGKTTFCDQV